MITAPSPTPPAPAPMAKLPELRPLQTRIVFQEFAPTEESNRFIDVATDMTPITTPPKFDKLADAIEAARLLSEKTSPGKGQDVRPFAVLSSTNSETPMFFVRGASVVGAGTLKYGDVSKSPTEWTGRVDELPAWHETVESASISPLAITARDATQAALSVVALVTQHSVFDRVAGERRLFAGPTWDRKLPWR